MEGQERIEMFAAAALSGLIAAAAQPADMQRLCETAWNAGRMMARVADEAAERAAAERKHSPPRNGETMSQYQARMARDGGL